MQNCILRSEAPHSAHPEAVLFSLLPLPPQSLPLLSEAPQPSRNGHRQKYFVPQKTVLLTGKQFPAAPRLPLTSSLPKKDGETVLPKKTEFSLAAPSRSEDHNTIPMPVSDFFPLPHAPCQKSCLQSGWCTLPQYPQQ